MIQLINKNQTTQSFTYFYDGRSVSFDKDDGHTFSDEEVTPELKRYFIKCMGCELVPEKKTFFGNQSHKKENKVSNIVPKREDKKVIQEPKLETKKEVKEE